MKPDTAAFLENVRAATEDERERLCESEAREVFRPSGAPEELGSAVRSAGDRCLARMLNDPFFSKVAEAAQAPRTSADLVGYDLRNLMPPLVFNPPMPVEARLRGLVAAAVAGSGAGALVGSPLALWVIGERNIGLVLGGALGAAALVWIVGVVARSKRTRWILQTVLGLGVLGLIAERLTPRAVWGRFRPGAGVLGFAKRILGVSSCLLALQLAAPKKLTPPEFQDDFRAQLSRWVLHATDLVAWLALCHAPAAEAPGAPQPVPEPVLRVLQKLDMAEAPDEKLETLEELKQELDTAGFAFREPTPEVFERGLEEHYDVMGLIEPGDACRALKPPVLRGGEVVTKGVIVRKRV